MMGDATPLRITVVFMAVALFGLIWLYIAGRLITLGVVRSWFEFKNKSKKGSRYGSKRKDDTVG